MARACCELADRERQYIVRSAACPGAARPWPGRGQAAVWPRAGGPYGQATAICRCLPRKDCDD